MPNFVKNQRMNKSRCAACIVIIRGRRQITFGNPIDTLTNFLFNLLGLYRILSIPIPLPPDGYGKKARIRSIKKLP